MSWWQDGSEGVANFPVYRASGSWLTGASPTDIATLTATTRKIHILHAWISVSQSANGIVIFRCQRRSSPNSGGVSQTPQISKFDKSRFDPTGIFKRYTSAPIVGTFDSSLRESPVLISGGGSQTGLVEWEFQHNDFDGLILNIGETLAFSVSNISDLATAYLTLEWCENTGEQERAMSNLHNYGEGA